MVLSFFVVIAMDMPHDSSEAKRQMLADCRAHYRNNPQQLAAIDDFGQTYRPEDAIFWYTKACFIFQIINRVLRTEDVRAFYLYRYFIVTMCKRLEAEAIVTKSLYIEPFFVYRGSKLSRDEAEKLRVGTLVATNGFFSTSSSLNVAHLFLAVDDNTGTTPSRSREDQCQFVLFKIEVDFTNSPDICVADVSQLSAMPDENEMIFGLGTTFIITNVTYDAEHHFWHVQMTSSSEVAKLNRDYTAYIRDRLAEVTPTLLFGNVLAEMTGDFPGAMAYFHRLLRTMSSDNEDRPNVYYEIARVYRFMGKFQQAITYFRAAKLLQRRRLPQWAYRYGLTLASLGTAYSEIGDSTRAIEMHTRSMLLHRGLFSADHVDMAYHLEQLAYDYWQIREYERSLGLISKALFLFKKGMPVDYPGQARALHTMGIIQHSMGDREQALYHFIKALRMRESLLASDHPFVARTCHQLSVVYAERDSDKEIALTYARRALNIRKNKLSPNHNELKKSIELVEQLARKLIVNRQSTS